MESKARDTTTRLHSPSASATAMTPKAPSCTSAFTEGRRERPKRDPVSHSDVMRLEDVRPARHTDHFIHNPSTSMISSFPRLLQESCKPVQLADSPPSMATREVHDNDADRETDQIDDHRCPEPGE